MIFDYPQRLDRIHGPAGYATYESYRPWLRDEFTFRCVYCLKREMWGQFTGEFELDHFEPQSLRPALKLDYLNLVYACRRCNLAKMDQVIADPLMVLSSEAVTTLSDGAIFSQQVEAKKLIRQLDLNSPKLIQWRVRWMRIIDLARVHDDDLYRQLTGYPSDLPNLSLLMPPSNSRPEGIEMSWFSKRERGLLPNSY